MAHRFVWGGEPLCYEGHIFNPEIDLAIEQKGAGGRRSETRVFGLVRGDTDTRGGGGSRLPGAMRERKLSSVGEARCYLEGEAL